jgi:lambda family phage portal protein
MLSVHDLPNAGATAPGTDLLQRSEWRWRIEDGTKFPGGFGPTEILVTDYWTLRMRSSQLFEQNLYARGVLRRLITNEINTGLSLEAQPVASILDMEDEAIAKWTDEVEDLFMVWGDQPNIVDWTRRSTWGQLQAAARLEALIAGDVLCVMRRDRRTGLPRIQLINGALIQTPFTANNPPRNGNEIDHGVELDKNGRQVAYWVLQSDGTSKRLPAFGERSGRRIAWLVYGTDKRLHNVRGRPMLSLIMQGLKEIDRYRDAALRKAVINSMLAMVVTKDADKPGSNPMTAGAVRRSNEAVTDINGDTRVLKSADFYPGIVVDELQTGEDIKAFGADGTDTNFGPFEEAMIQTIAWANEVPPEILRLSFSNNYSASQAAINEFKIYLNRMRTDFGRDFCRPIYVEWLVSMALENRITASGLLESWRNRAAFDVFGAWIHSDWSGQVKPSTDPVKLIKAYQAQLAEGVITRAKVARELGNGKYSQIAKQLERENEQLAKTNAPVQGMAMESSGDGGSEGLSNDERDALENVAN